MKLSLTGYSTALFSTWILVEELGILFDCGDGAVSGLLQKSRKARHIFISHADRDHLAGLMQLHELNARDGVPAVYYPRDCGSFPALQEFLGKFDPGSGPASWSGIGEERIEVGRDHHVLARRNGHVDAGGMIKSLGFTVVHTKKRLKERLRGLSGPEIANLRREHGDEAVATEVRQKVIGYSGDTPGLEAECWEGVGVLIHEATFLDSQEARSAHAHLGQVIHGASIVNPDRLVLTHFSSRYKRQEIVAAIRQRAKQERIRFPIHAIFPGEVSRDILGSEPVWSD